MFTQFFMEFLSITVVYFTYKGLDDVNNLQDSESISKTLERNLNALSAKASDVKDEVEHAELSGRKKRKREVEEWLRHVGSIEIEEVVELVGRVETSGFITRLMNRGKTAKLNERVEKLVEQSRNFGELVLDVAHAGTSGEPLLTNGLVGKAMKENLETILGLLERREALSIGVYGSGGVGKTLLTKHIYNEILRRSVGYVVWVTVSQNFTMKSLQDKIAHFMGVSLSDEDEEDIRAVILHRAFSRHRDSVLILDDVWENIDMLKVGCCDCLRCCRLIITTRSSEVCRQIGCQEVIGVLEGL